MTAQIEGDDCEVLLQAFDITHFMPLLAIGSAAMQQHDRRIRAATIISNTSAIW